MPGDKDINAIHYAVHGGRGGEIIEFCKFCERNVRPEKGWSWVGFIFGLGIFYLPWYFFKAPHCPICNAKLGKLKRD